MPEKKVVERARRAKRAGLSASSQAGEFIREEIRHIREGRHGARSTEQAIAIGLSKARRAGVDLRPPKKGKASAETRRLAKRAYELGHGAKPTRRSTRRQKRALRRRLRRYGRAAASRSALARHARKVARRRTRKDREASARKAVRTKGHRALVAAAKKAARTRARKK